MGSTVSTGAPDDTVLARDCDNDVSAFKANVVRVRDLVVVLLAEKAREWLDRTRPPDSPSVGG